MARPDLVLMGRAAGAFGLGGELKVSSFAEDPEVFTRAGIFYAGADPGSARRYRLAGVRPHAGRLLFKVEGITSREQAAALGGAFVYLDAAELEPAAEGEYYWHQARGAEVFLPSGLRLGSIRGVMDGGGHDLWVVAGEAGREAVLPVVETVVLDMDLKAGKVVVRPPEGLLEAQGWPEEYLEEGPAR